MRHLFGFKGLLSLVTLFLLLQIPPAFATGSKLLILGTKSQTQSDTEANKENEASDRIVSEAAETLVLTLSDEQVQRLVDALASQPQQDATGGDEEVGGLVGLIRSLRFVANDIQWRYHELKSGAGLEPDEMPHLYRLLGKAEDKEKADPFTTIMGVVGLFVASLFIVLFFHRTAASSYRRIENATSVNMKSRVGGLALRALLDILFMFIFTIVTLALFFIFMDRTGPQRVLVATYLAAFLIVMAVKIVSRFFLADNAPALRFLPLDDHTAVYFHRWLTAIAAVITFGWFTCGIFRVAGASEANHLLMVSLVSLVAISMVIIIILQKRKQVQQILASGFPEKGFRAYIAKIWHIPAIIAALVLWLLSTFNQFLGEVLPGAPGVKTLVLIPLYFLFDWALREILRVAFGITAKSEAVTQSQRLSNLEVPDSETEGKTADSTDAETVEKFEAQDEEALSTDTETEESLVGKHLDVRRINRIIGGGLRIALGAFFFLYLLEIWGFDIEFGIAVTKAVTRILIVVLVCYVVWEIISAMIQRKLAEEMPETDEDMEEGGAGGSRIGTLLLLLRKFLFVVIVVMATMTLLSSIGVDIGPLIAGAGVIGLAIGFGAQTLVKDIIAGVFFLMDDAFRVGDYIETAGTKGLVDHISLRSLRLRHPRGMVNTIPFGDIGIVTNMSRDYIITKLDFRVRYDTDVEKVRKIIKKKVYGPIMQNEELAPKLLDKIKSQGVRQMDDSAMIMRVKYKTAPGEQFVIRKEVYRLMQEAFAEEGIEFAHRNVTVYMPSDHNEPEPGTQPDAGAATTGAADKTPLEKAAAAAALATIQAEEEEMKKKNSENM